MHKQVIKQPSQTPPRRKMFIGFLAIGLVPIFLTVLARSGSNNKSDVSEPLPSIVVSSIPLESLTPDSSKLLLQSDPQQSSVQVSPLTQVSTAPTPTPSQASKKTSDTPKASVDTQVIRATYTEFDGMIPTEFVVNVNQPVRFEIEAKDDGSGCMGSVTIPELTSEVKVFEKGKVIIFEFIPTKEGTYPITCAMGIPHGNLRVI